MNIPREVGLLVSGTSKTILKNVWGRHVRLIGDSKPWKNSGDVGSMFDASPGLTKKDNRNNRYELIVLRISRLKWMAVHTWQQQRQWPTTSLKSLVSHHSSSRAKLVQIKWSLSLMGSLEFILSKLLFSSTIAGIGDADSYQSMNEIGLFCVYSSLLCSMWWTHILSVFYVFLCAMYSSERSDSQTRYMVIYDVFYLM